MRSSRLSIFWVSLLGLVLLIMLIWSDLLMNPGQQQIVAFNDDFSTTHLVGDWSNPLADLQMVYYDDFSTNPNTSGLWHIYRRNETDLTNEASWDPDSQVFYLTRAARDRSVAMFANYELKATNWEVQFRYKVGGGSGADGFVFLFYKDEAAYGKPGCGGSLGFQISYNSCIPQSSVSGYGIEFDGFYNPPSSNIGDPSPSHIAVIKDTVGNHLAYSNDPRTKDNIWHDVVIRFNNGHVVVEVDESTVLDYMIANPDYTYSGIGFSASTGYHTNNHIIDDFVIHTSPGTNFSIPHIEVTQVIQDEANDVPLIAGKPTFVRVYVDCGVGCTAVPGVTGTLEVSSSAGTATYQPNMGPITVEHPPTPPGWASQRGHLHKTLNFYTISTGLLTGDVTFTAQVGDATLSEPLSFVPGKELRIAWVPIHYQPNRPDPPNHRPDETIARQAISFMGKTFPIAWADLDYFQQPLQPANQNLLTFTSQHQFTAQNAWNEYLPRLDQVWQAISAANGWRNGQPDRLFGWIPSEARPPDGDTYGYAYAAWWCPSGQPGSCGSGRVAAGLAQPLWLGDLKMPSTVGLAHEIAHLLDDSGLKHAACGIAGSPGSPDVPLSGGRIDNWGIDFIGRSPTLYSPAPMHSNRAYDFMSYCDPGWVSIFHYRRLEEGFQDYSPQAQNLYTSYRVLSVLGTVYTPTLTVDFGTFYPLDSVVPPDASRGTDYCLELRNADEILLDSRCFDLSFTLPESGDLTDAESFTLLLPYPEETRSLVLTYNGSELDRVSQTNNVPTVQLLSPNGGEMWSASGTYTVTWTASDADGDPLRFMVSYSDDDGETWMPLALDITDNFLAVDSPNIPGSTTARFKVMATDQMLTGEDASDASFTVGSKGPTAFILLPERERIIPPNLPLYLQGRAYDLEDGTLKDNALQWSSSIDGDLGSGQIIIAMLSPGAHTITLTATDSDGNQDTATLDLYVGHKLYLPVVRR